MNNRAKIVIIFISAALLAGFFFYLNKTTQAEKVANQEQVTHEHQHAHSDSTETEKLDSHGSLESAEAFNTYDIGSVDAPVTIIEYASFSCVHCAAFHNEVLSDLKKELVETGKARFIFRSFPTNGPAYNATKLAHCVPQSRYTGIVDVLFKNQQFWLEASDLDQTLIQMGRLAGIGADAYQDCQVDADLERAILDRFKEAQEVYKVNSTPTFIFIAKDGRVEKFSGVRSVKAFKGVIEKLSK